MGWLHDNIELDVGNDRQANSKPLLDLRACTLNLLCCHRRLFTNNASQHTHRATAVHTDMPHRTSANLDGSPAIVRLRSPMKQALP